MPGMVEVNVLKTFKGVRCKFRGRTDLLNVLPLVPQDLKKHLIMDAGKEVKVDLPCGTYKIVAMDENYRTISINYDKKTDQILKELQYCDTLMENGWKLTAYVLHSGDEYAPIGDKRYFFMKWTTDDQTLVSQDAWYKPRC